MRYPKYADRAWVLKGGRVVEEKPDGKYPGRERAPLIRKAFEDAEKLCKKEQKGKESKYAGAGKSNR